MTRLAETAAGALFLAAVTVVLLLLLRPTGPGQVTLGIRYEGGPNPAVLADLWAPGVISVYRSDGSLVTSRHLAAGETFTADLPSGTYRVLGHSGHAECEPATITVANAATVTMPVVCGVK
jgi:hypothetical protein